MNWPLVKRVADALLYEGYILYPYRATSVKNRQRFNFGVLLPRGFSTDSSDRETRPMRTECLVEGIAPIVEVRVRFLHLLSREVSRLATSGSGESYEPVDSIEIHGRVYSTWQEAVEREVEVTHIHLPDCANRPQTLNFSFGPSEQSEQLLDASGVVVGQIVRRHEHVEGMLTIEATPLRDRLWKVSALIQNTTPLPDSAARSRDVALMYSLISAHTVLAVADGQLSSLLEPDPELAAEAALCRNEGTWPVLVGDEGERDMMLSSPIILYDYPQVSPESNGDFFDGTEIDEMLALRVMTLTDDEKRLMRAVDERARQILERTENLPQSHMTKLHGAMRNPSQMPLSGS